MEFFVIQFSHFGHREFPPNTISTQNFYLEQSDVFNLARDKVYEYALASVFFFSQSMFFNELRVSSSLQIWNHFDVTDHYIWIMAIVNLYDIYCNWARTFSIIFSVGCILYREKNHRAPNGIAKYYLSKTKLKRWNNKSMSLVVVGWTKGEASIHANCVKHLISQY